MEWRNKIAWTPPLTYVVDLGLLLAGGISALARSTLTDYVALFSLLDLRLLLAGGNSVLAGLICYFILFSLHNRGCHWSEISPPSPGGLYYFLFFYSTVVVTGRKYLRPRPVDCTILFYFILLNRGCHWSEVSPPSPG